MKKIILIALTVVLALSLAACTKKESSVIKIGATPVPHSQLLELVKDDLKAEGIEIEIVEFTDYVKPNLALAEGELDLNFFQHAPYLDSFAKENNLELSSIGTIHVEPLGVYSNKYDDISKLEDGSLVAIPSDPVNGGRALILLEANGLIKLSEGAGLEATEKDIAENPKNLEFKALEAAQLARVLEDVGIAVINGNFALEAGLVPTEDALLLEGADSPYANILVSRLEDKDNETYLKILEALQSEKVSDYILENYGGGVVPAFGK